MTSSASTDRWAWAQIDLTAITHNIEVLRAAVAPAQVWAVVKADGYGHGAIDAAGAAQRGGATGLCVALVQEGLELRAAGIDGPLLVLSEQPPAQAAAAVAADLTSTVASAAGIRALAVTGSSAPVHLKVDTGMHRGGCEPGEAVSLAQSALSSGLSLRGVFTHLAVADSPDDDFTDRQLDVFDDVLQQFADSGIDPGLVHAGNSAAALAQPRAQRHMVRAGIATYGISPGIGVDDLAGALLPALSLHARVAVVRRLAAGERISYGLRHRFAHDTTVAVVPIGYADGVPRRSFDCGIEVLIGGRRCPIVGVVTMDQLMVDVGDLAVAVGDGVVLIGRQDQQFIGTDEWARRLGTIGYEVVCGLSARLPRVIVS
jgi:alanine racemase